MIHKQRAINNVQCTMTNRNLKCEVDKDHSTFNFQLLTFNFQLLTFNF